MKYSILDAIKHRRTYYALKNESPISNDELRQIIEQSVKYVPSAFNSQSTRLVVLIGDKHRKVWELTKDVLRGMVSPENFPATENKINTAFESGYGTVLYYEDQAVVRGLQEQFPAYADNFPVWSEHTNAMHQLTIWTALEEVGFGASLQHYNPIIDDSLAKEFNINPNWKLRAQMPFGLPACDAGEKAFEPLEKRIVFFK